MVAKLEIRQLSALKDNYIYILQGGGQTAVIDPSLAAPVIEALQKEGLQLDYILNTHHHWDHTDGNLELKEKTGAKVVGYAGDAARIRGIDIKLQDGDIFNVCGLDAKIIFTPGHTLGHIVYYFSEIKSLFCGDTLFSLGCGRLFEGTPQQMFDSLSKIKELPSDTLIYCGHEYTESNGIFAATILPDNKALQARIKEVKLLRANAMPTIPTILTKELQTNPFLIAKDVTEFTNIRLLKDRF